VKPNGEWKLLVLVVLVSVVALVGLFILIYGNPYTTDSNRFAFLPAVNASCNAVTTVFLLFGVQQVKKGRLENHERLMKSAFLSSTLFLIGYLVYHRFHGDTPFLGQGWVRPVYFTVLISHIVLSVFALPLVLFSFAVALKKNFALHKRVVRWAFPIWLYVSVTGVAIFVFLKQFPNSNS
jgi:putative membrane protein